ncbi:uncharacterized protein ACRADG_001962 [Cochliomyia hominivorax]
MALKCLDQLTSSLILATLSLAACIVRAEFLISVLEDLKQPNREVDRNINILLIINTTLYLILAIFSVLLIYAIIKKRHTLMLPWLITALASISCEILFVLYILAKGHGKQILFILIGSALGIWIVWIMFSLFKTIRQENRSKDLENIQGYRYSLTRSEDVCNSYVL